jgi:hypothetical protein
MELTDTEKLIFMRLERLEELSAEADIDPNFVQRAISTN